MVADLTCWREKPLGVATLLLVLACGLSLAACDSEYTHRSSIAPTDRLTESVALSRTREAIRHAGYDPSSVEPVCYGQPCESSEPYFARNTLDPNRGYVLWRFKADTRTKYQLSVTIERQGDQLTCSVGRVK